MGRRSKRSESHAQRKAERDMIIRKIIGALLIASPLLGLLGFGYVDFGIGFVAFILAPFAVVGVFGAGVYLMVMES